jgi:molybdopterin adenylyltransferase
MKIGRITLLDGAMSAATAETLGPEIELTVSRIFEDPCDFTSVIVSDAKQFQAALIRLCDEEKCPLVVTTGGTGPGPLDVVPEVTRGLLDRELPGFGETMRHYSFQRGPIALLSRATAGVRGKSVVINLPSRPKAIKGCLTLLREAITECLEQVTGIRYKLHVPEIVIPMEKFLPFLKRFRVKPDPRWE